MMPPKAKAAPDARGTVEDGVSYTLPEFMRRVGLAEWGMRSARRAGLRVTRVGNRAFVLGADWHDFLRSQAATRRK